MCWIVHSAETAKKSAEDGQADPLDLRRKMAKLLESVAAAVRQRTAGGRKDFALTHPTGIADQPTGIAEHKGKMAKLGDSIRQRLAPERKDLALTHPTGLAEQKRLSRRRIARRAYC